jgi:hypothetical protein
MESGGKARSRSTWLDALWRRRTSREPSRVDATCEEIDGADSQDEPKTTKDAAAEQRLRSPSGRVRKTLGEPRERFVRGELNDPRKKIGRRYRPERQTLKVRGNVRRGVSARLKRSAEAAGTSESSEGGEREGTTSRDREVEEPRRVGSPKRQADSAATQDSGAPHDVR